MESSHIVLCYLVVLTLIGKKDLENQSMLGWEVLYQSLTKEIWNGWTQKLQGNWLQIFLIWRWDSSQCWQGHPPFIFWEKNGPIRNDGWLYGNVNKKHGPFTGDNIAYIYSDLKTALVGTFNDSVMIAARETKIIGYRFAHLFRESLNYPPDY